MSIIKDIKYINKLKKDTNDMTFLNNISRINKQIDINEINKNNDYEQKIQKHYQIIKKMFLNKKSNDIRYLEAKKMAYNYHLYLLNNYYKEICKTKYLEKLSN